MTPLADIKEPSSRKNWIGIGFTLIYIALVVGFVVYRGGILDLELNALGDFLAGVFAPLAFGWLVLGFFQQGEELRASTAALRLQADELQASVQEQRNMVEVAQRQFQHELERVAAAETEADKQAEPIFLLVDQGTQNSVPPGHFYTLKNVGPACTNLTVNYPTGKKHKPFFDSTEQIDIYFKLDPFTVQEVEVSLSYIDLRGARKAHVITLFPVDNRLIVPA